MKHSITWASKSTVRVLLQNGKATLAVLTLLRETRVGRKRSPTALEEEEEDCEGERDWESLTEGEKGGLGTP